MGIKTFRKQRVSTCEVTNDEIEWRWLWKNTVLPEDWFSNRFSENREKAERNFAILFANRVLYPDGTINGSVQRHLREKVLSLFGMTKKNKPAA